jgi:hypothetical protein
MSSVESLKRERDNGEGAAPGGDADDVKKVKASDEHADTMAPNSGTTVGALRLNDDELQAAIFDVDGKIVIRFVISLGRIH